MYIENVTQHAFDDVSAEDPDFAFIQGGKTCQPPCLKFLSIELFSWKFDFGVAAGLGALNIFYDCLLDFQRCGKAL
jgi:hypothetical protein